MSWSEHATARQRSRAVAVTFSQRVPRSPLVARAASTAARERRPSAPPTHRCPGKRAAARRPRTRAPEFVPAGSRKGASDPISRTCARWLRSKPVGSVSCGARGDASEFTARLAERRRPCRAAARVPAPPGAHIVDPDVANSGALADAGPLERPNRGPGADGPASESESTRTVAGITTLILARRGCPCGSGPDGGCRCPSAANPTR